MAQKFVGAPVFREFDSGATEVAVILLQLGLETAEQSESVGGRTGKSGKNFLLIEPADLLGAVFDDGLAQCDLAVASHDHLSLTANAEDRGGADHGLDLARRPGRGNSPFARPGMGGEQGPRRDVGDLLRGNTAAVLLVHGPAQTGDLTFGEQRPMWRRIDRALELGE